MSSYISPAPQGDAKATGAYAVAIAATPAGVNNDGHATDSAGNVAVDFSWGNFPLQPNDVRRASVTNFGGETGDNGWSETTMVASQNLAYGTFNAYSGSNVIADRPVKPDNHQIAESGWSGFPAYVRGNSAVYIITQASGDGSTQTYTCPNNFLAAGDTVNITGTGLDGDGLTVATANRYTFTVSGSGTGDYINITGRVRYADELTANDGAYIAGTDYVKVPNVVGLTTALAQDALNDAEFGTITVASAVTPAISTVALTTNVATITTSAAHGYASGDSVTIAALVNGSGNASADADLNGTYTITGVTSTTFTFAKTHTNITSHSVSAGTAKVAARAGTIKTQSVAAGANSISAGASITITPYFAS